MMILELSRRDNPRIFRHNSKLLEDFVESSKMDIFGVENRSVEVENAMGDIFDSHC